jgi:COQ9
VEEEEVVAGDTARGDRPLHDAGGRSRDGRAHRAAYAIRARIEMLAPWKSNWAQALALQALPQNAPHALRASAALADEVAHYAGHRTPDVSFLWSTAAAIVQNLSTRTCLLTPPRPSVFFPPPS